MELEKFNGANKTELSMIEVARAILNQKGDVMAFADLTNEIQQFLGKSDEEIRDRLPQFYTDLNVDGSFISLGDNLWGLRSWYPYESIDEALVHSEDEDDEERPKRKSRKKVNAFLDDETDDDDVIDYDDDDPEDQDYDEDDDDSDDESEELKEYGKDLSDIDDSNDDDEDELPDGIEGQLSELDDDDDEDEDDSEN
ncbi:DNA-directed RNA polymerase subunit delta [Ligilactobacillus salitolerans]|uniref:Probable DNA-directed RNA polymerase subunit delta n=1 Tax=Ligilactobacillus salitolerans TaxID=1808352 RepID=A0A401IS69_9LACO|nr:DNA-directed RNA polymerase subunit delta [Ligilactobacillus salitolerans]GBG94345.1 DNA-directed RNA polymerase subunit delta [Ligilactobacillus salitolerans]